MVGLNPEFAHETMSGLSFHQGVAQTLWAGKLFHIDLNAQVAGKFDQDFRFGSEGLKDAFFLVRLLEGSGWDGMRHFDAHPYRTEGPEGVWDFASGCMRTYLMLAERAVAFDADPEVQAAMAVARVADLSVPTSVGDAAALRAHVAGLDEEALAATHYGHERLDQLTVEHILGVR
jgi:xylose isomerase